ncbi:hypothetical protein EMIT048CA2_270015 [Pseudomonas chlororaphis]
MCEVAIWIRLLILRKRTRSLSWHCFPPMLEGGTVIQRIVDEVPEAVVCTHSPYVLGRVASIRDGFLQPDLNSLVKITGCQHFLSVGVPRFPFLVRRKKRIYKWKAHQQNPFQWWF